MYLNTETAGYDKKNGEVGVKEKIIERERKGRRRKIVK